MTLRLFSYLPDTERLIRHDKHNFSSLKQVPKCRKYSSPVHLSFILADRVFCNWEMVNLDVKIENLIKVDESHFMSLHPVRYDKVKHAISMGNIDMPIVYLDLDRKPLVQDGRHRVIALYKFGFKRIEIAVPREQKKEIRSLLSR